MSIVCLADESLEILTLISLKITKTMSSAAVVMAKLVDIFCGTCSVVKMKIDTPYARIKN